MELLERCVLYVLHDYPPSSLPLTESYPLGGSFQFEIPRKEKAYFYE
jgi:hypothetical protein